MTKHYGIITQTGMPFRQTCKVFDATLGLIESCSLKHEIIKRLHHGMLIEYTLTEKGTRYDLEAVQIVAVPAGWIIEDIELLHGIFKLLHTVMFCGNPHPELFKTLSLLFKEFREQEMPAYFKRWFVCRLFFLLDLYPEQYHLFDPHVFHLISSPFDIMVKIQHDADLCDQKFLRWLQRCSQEHPECTLIV